MFQRRNIILFLILVLCCSLPFGCSDDVDDVLVEAPGVIQQESTYWVGDVMVNQRETVIRRYDWITCDYRGSVKNFGSSDLENARFEILSADEIRHPDGTIEYRDEEVGASQSMGTLAPQQELPISLTYSYPSVANRRIRGVFRSGDDS